MLRYNRYIFLRAVIITAFNAMSNETHNTQMTAGERERTITLYLTPEEKDAVTRAANKKGLTVAEYLRYALLEECRRRLITSNPAA
jgi:hypothetical protein